MNYENIVKSTTKNVPGLIPMGYWARKDDIETWPALPAVPTTVAQEITLAGNFVMKTGKFFRTLYTTDDGYAKLGSEVQGEKDNQTKKIKAQFYAPGTSDANLAFAKNADYDDLLFIFLERDRTRRVIGNEDFQTLTKVKDDTGEGVTGKKGIFVEIELDSLTPAPKYNGAIPLDGSQVDPIS